MEERKKKRKFEHFVLSLIFFFCISTKMNIVIGNIFSEYKIITITFPIRVHKNVPRLTFPSSTF